MSGVMEVPCGFMEHYVKFYQKHQHMTITIRHHRKIFYRFHPTATSLVVCIVSKLSCWCCSGKHTGWKSARVCFGPSVCNIYLLLHLTEACLRICLSIAALCLGGSCLRSVNPGTCNNILLGRQYALGIHSGWFRPALWEHFRGKLTPGINCI